jgi:hypothetical protein
MQLELWRPPVQHIMIDIETLGVNENAVITSIAAVSFKIDYITYEVTSIGVSPNKRFEANLELSQPDRFIDQSTFIWWQNQPEEARNKWFKATNKQSLNDALEALMSFIHELGNPKEMYFWARGVNFDYSILNHAFKQVGLIAPWRYSQLMDVRTLDALLPKDFIKTLPTIGTAHNAIDDCYFQIEYIAQALNHLHN